MDPFHGNKRLEQNVEYGLHWAYYMKKNGEELMPFLLEWNNANNLKMKPLFTEGDPELFAYEVAKKSDFEFDQFLVGYDGFLTDQHGNKIQSIIIKAFDKTQPKGVFIAHFYNIEDKIKLKLNGNPKLMQSPNLPFPINSSANPNYYAEELYASIHDHQEKGDEVILSHDNPAVIADGIKRYFTKYSNSEATDNKDFVTFAIAPQEIFGDFFRYTIIRAIKNELESPFVSKWESSNNKKLNIACIYGDEIIYSSKEQILNKTTSKNINEQKSGELNTMNTMISKYQDFTRIELDKEFFRIVSVPNARTNVQCLEQMTALLEVYDLKGFQRPETNSKQKPKPKSGCISIMVLLIIATSALLIV